MEISLGMDNDSGYVSHYQESNLDCSSENVFSTNAKSFPSQDMYMSEDALLEKPAVESTECDSVIDCSQGSVKTEFSGFDDSDRSDVSFVIPEVRPIVWNSSEWSEKSDLDKSEESFNCSQESISSCNEVSSQPIYKVFANVTNTHDDNINQAVIKNVFNESNKENIRPSETPIKQYENRLTSDISPDLFAEEEEFSKVVISVKKKSPVKKTATENYDKDFKLLKKVQSCLTGVYPPPSLTIIQMTVNEMLEKIEQNKTFFWEKPKNEEGKSYEPTWIWTKFPQILRYRYHGLHHNRNKVSEDFEHLCSRYAERYVGAETQSTCTVFESNPPSSQKRKISKPKWGAKSPGRRLSHLARRRITFCSANLQSSNSSSILGSRARQILIDTKKLNLSRKSPKKSPRKTPSKSPFKIRKNTPSSSAKKKLAMRFRQMSGEFESVSSSSSSSVTGLKRALFSSPKEEKSSLSGALIEKRSTKRALFSSPLKRSSPSKSPFKLGKRKRNDVDEENPAKLARSVSLDIKPSQSESKVLNRTLSDTSFRSKSEEMSDVHKKKLQWAVYESLRLQNITADHPQFKVFASVLARVTRKFLPNVRLEGRTTDKMFRIARYHSYAVVKGKSVDEIVNEYMKNRTRNQKPQGYIGIEEFQNMKNNDNFLDKENVLQRKANILESIEKRRELAGNRSKFLSENRIDRIKKVISFEDK